METANQYVKNKHNREENLMNKSAVFAYYRNMIDNVGKVIRKQIEVNALAWAIGFLTTSRKVMSAIRKK